MPVLRSLLDHLLRLSQEVNSMHYPKISDRELEHCPGLQPTKYFERKAHWHEIGYRCPCGHELVTDRKLFKETEEKLAKVRARMAEGAFR